MSEYETLISEIRTLHDKFNNLEERLVNSDLIGEVGGIEVAAKFYNIDSQSLYKRMKLSDPPFPFLIRGTGRNKYCVSLEHLKRHRMGEDVHRLIAEMEERWPK